MLEPQTASSTSPTSTTEQQQQLLQSPSASSQQQQQQQPVRIIPRLVDSAGGQVSSANRGQRDSNLDPSTWTVEEVSHFLQINECATLVDSFAEKVS